MNAELQETMNRLADTHANLVKAGMAHEREKLLPLFAAIFAAYDRAAADPAAVLPTPLSVAIYVARSVVERG